MYLYIVFRISDYKYWFFLIFLKSLVFHDYIYLLIIILTKHLLVRNLTILVLDRLVYCTIMMFYVGTLFHNQYKVVSLVWSEAMRNFEKKLVHWNILFNSTVKVFFATSTKPPIKFYWLLFYQNTTDFPITIKCDIIKCNFSSFQITTWY